MNKVSILAFYLPQYHPIPENDQWWGKGFTEWTSVAKAKPLFKGHDQPKIPGDLGFYDLRLPQVRKAQAELAKRAGVSAFCYWHYWFGNGKQLLEQPFNEVLKLKEPDFPFCLAWANHDWLSKNWTTNGQVVYGRSKLLIKQEYGGVEDYTAHFYALKEAFLDNRYYKVEGRLLFMVYNYKEIPDFELFKKTWNTLATQEGLPGFFFVTHILDPQIVLNEKAVLEVLEKGYDAVNLSLHHVPFIKRSSFLERNIPFYEKQKKRFKSHFSIKPQVVEYAQAIKMMDSSLFENESVFPTIIPNWDHTPRSGRFGRVFQNCTPELFGKHVIDVLKRIRHKKEERKIIFLKSWNEWGEGNYLEPDLKYRCAFIDKLREALENEKENETT